MGKLTDKAITAIIKSGDAGRFADGDGLYLCLRAAGKAYWALRYTANGKRRIFTIGNYERLSLSSARTEAGRLRDKIAKDSTDPVAERHREEQMAIRTTDELFEDWYSQHSKRLKHPRIPRRKYERDIQPVIGGLTVDAVTPRDVRIVIQKVTASKRPTLATMHWR
ncbi:integrase arm-type DNA-binding domain-containing protein [Aestuariirhabdus litorea]|uniref:integrase arm-type DNA-binding domain-containing protein n=1 Tax=Aestuariirhabdus litorea TaxID=2528527 RepID=UPI0013E30521|nr:integrase arm-type DNA-binding domain-containing protein [Aestuariirhabdus litorea]